MKRSTAVRVAGLFAATLTFLVALPVAEAATATPTVVGYPVLLAKSWLIGYTIVGLSILLGTLAVLISSMRKVVRKKTT